ncbi:unnamed protein product, partial [Prorocentrum cordatum]
VPVVRGSPYVTAEYAGATPRLSTEQQLRPDAEGRFRVGVDGEAAGCDPGRPLSGKVLTFGLVQSDATWAVFSPPGVEWTCTPEPFALTASGPVRDGAVRAAIVNSCTTGARPHHCEGFPEGRDASAYLGLLSDHAGAYPVGVSWDFEVAEREGHVTWELGRPGDGRDEGRRGPRAARLPRARPLAFQRPARLGGGGRAGFALPRHPRACQARRGQELDAHVPPLPGRGAGRAAADRWRAAGGDAAGAAWPWQRDVERQHARQGSGDFDLPLNYRLGVGDTYFAGKMLARLARLVVIADELGESREAYFSDMVGRLTDRMEAWFHEDSGAPFIYDTTWGGLLSCGCSYDDCGGECDPYCSNDKIEARDELPRPHVGRHELRQRLL